MTNSRFSVLMTSLMTLSLAACTRPGSEDSAKVSLDLPSKTYSTNLKSAEKGQEMAIEETLVHASVKVSQNGSLVKNGEVNWSLCREGDGGCDPNNKSPNLEFEIDTGKETVFQVLAVYEAGQQTVFYYGDTSQTVTTTGNVPVALAKLSSSIVVGHASGRYFTGVDKGPTGVVDVLFEPPGRLPLRLESSVILNGWFDMLMMWGQPLKYVVHDAEKGELVLWNKPMALDAPEMDPYSGSAALENRLMKVFYPIGVRIESGNSSAPRQEDASIHAWGYWVDPNAADGATAVQNKLICRDNLSNPTFLRLHKWAPATTMSNAPVQQLASLARGETPPTPAQLTDTSANMNILIAGGATMSTSCGSWADTDANRYLNFQKIGISQVDASQDEHAGFRQFMRLASSATGSQTFVVTGTTTKTVSGRVLPGLENLFSKIKFYKNTTTPNTRLNPVDCTKLVNGAAGDKMNFTDGSLTDAQVAADGTLEVTSNITAAEAAAGVSAALCGMQGLNPFPMGLFLDRWLFQSGGITAMPMATTLKVTPPQRSGTTATIANSVCTPLHILGDTAGSPAFIPYGSVSLSGLSSVNVYGDPSCYTALSSITSYGGSEMIVYLKRTASGASAGNTLVLTATNNVTGSLNIDFVDPPSTIVKEIRAFFPSTINKYDCTQLLFESWHNNGGADQMMVSFPMSHMINLPDSSSGWTFYTDGACTNYPITSTYLNVSSQLFARYTGAATTGLSIPISVSGSCAGSCAPAPVLANITAIVPGPLANITGWASNAIYDGGCESIGVKLVDSQFRSTVGPATVRISSTNNADEFFSDGGCSTALNHPADYYTIAFDASTTSKTIYHRAHGAGSFTFNLQLEETGSSMSLPYVSRAVFDQVVLVPPGQSYDPTTGALSGTAWTAAQMFAAGTVTYDVYLRHQGQPYTETDAYAGYYSQTGLTVQNASYPIAFVNGHRSLAVQMNSSSSVSLGVSISSPTGSGSYQDTRTAP